MPEFQEQFLSETLLPFATEFSQQEFTPYTGEMVAGVSPLSMGAQTQFGQIARLQTSFSQAFLSQLQCKAKPLASFVAAHLKLLVSVRLEICMGKLATFRA
jgi:hypothetical protein